MKHIIFIIASITCLFCNNSLASAQETDTTFYFIIGSSNNSYNSKTKEFRRLYQHGVESYSIQLTHDELKQIRRAFQTANFTIMPAKYELKGGEKGGEIREVTPSFSYKLASNYGGKSKKIIYNNRTTDEAMRREVAPFLKLYREVFDIIHSNSEVENLRESNVYWE